MRWLPLVLVAAIVVGLLVWQDPSAVGLGPSVEASLAVAREERIGPCRSGFVPDGDTLDVTCEGKEEAERVRLLRIDTPERDQPGYGEARALLRELVRGEEIDVVLEKPGEPVRDRHGRLLAYLYVGPRNLNVEIVRRGWSRFEAGFGAGRFERAFLAAEAEAREARRGLHATL